MDKINNLIRKSLLLYMFKKIIICNYFVMNKKNFKHNIFIYFVHDLIICYSDLSP